MNYKFMKISIFFTIIFLFVNCRKELTVDIVPLSDERFIPSDKVTIYTDVNKIPMEYLTIAKLVLNGGEYEERLQKAVYSAKKSGGDAVIIKADQLSSGYEKNAMIAEIIKFVIRDPNKTSKDELIKTDKEETEEESQFESQEESQEKEYEEDSYQNRYE